MIVDLYLVYMTEVSVNSSHGLNKRTGTIYLKPIVGMWKKLVHAGINYCLPQGFQPHQLGDPPFNMDVEVRFPRKKSNVSGDAPNYDKVCRDAVAEALGVNDVDTSGTPSGSYGWGKTLSLIHLHITLNFKEGYGVKEIREFYAL